MSTLATSIGRSKAGFDTGDNFRFQRPHWEVFPESIGSKDARWALCNKGGEYAPYFEEPHLVVNWKALDHELGAVPGARVFNEEYRFRPGVVYPCGPRVTSAHVRLRATLHSTRARSSSTLTKGCGCIHCARIHAGIQNPRRGPRRWRRQRFRKCREELHSRCA